MKNRAWVLLLAVGLGGCAVGVESGEELGEVQAADVVWPDGTYARFLNSGRMYATHEYTDITYTGVIAAAAGSNWSQQNPERFKVIVDAMNEARVGRCGNVARARYNAVNDWCSEFARWSLLNSGMTNLTYCLAPAWRVPGACQTYWSLSQVKKTSQMVGLFSHFGGFTSDSAMTRTSVKPGDYLAMTGNSGRYHHSGIVLGISADYRWIWTVEGNVDDCVQPMLRPFFQDGVLNPDINGVGNIDIMF